MPITSFLHQLYVLEYVKRKLIIYELMKSIWKLLQNHEFTITRKKQAIVGVLNFRVNLQKPRVIGTTFLNTEMGLFQDVFIKYSNLPLQIQLTLRKTNTGQKGLYILKILPNQVLASIILKQRFSWSREIFKIPSFLRLVFSKFRLLLEVSPFYLNNLPYRQSQQNCPYRFLDHDIFIFTQIL